MKENTLDVLFYLFDNFSDYEDSNQNREVLHDHLEGAGYSTNEITKAFDWLESLATDEEIDIYSPKSHSVRIFSNREKIWLNRECQDYLIYLYSRGILSAELREVVIDRVLALHDANFGINRLKWVVLMILLNQPGKEAEYAWMDDIALGEEPPVYH